MIEEVFTNIFRLEIPLPRNPLKAVNSYVIKSPERVLIIDTGMNRSVCKEAMRSGLQELDVTLEDADFFITHIHSDHLGLVSELAAPQSKVYFNRPDAAIRRMKDRKEKVLAFFIENGFPEIKAYEAVKNHPGYRYNTSEELDFHLIDEGDIISIGQYRFQCIATPGHTLGHMCLYEQDEKILFSGDHILDSITPNIALLDYSNNLLDIYLKSLDKIYHFDVSVVFPGHRSPFRDHRKRIKELKEHHESRAEEVLSILHEGHQTAYQIASKMTWEIEYKEWEEFPLTQKWFATGEALAHLKYLEVEEQVRKSYSDGKAFFGVIN